MAFYGFGWGGISSNNELGTGALFYAPSSFGEGAEDYRVLGFGSNFDAYAGVNAYYSSTLQSFGR